MTTQLKITAFFRSPKVTKLQTRDIEKDDDDDDVYMLDDQDSPTGVENDNSVKDCGHEVKDQSDPVEDKNESVDKHSSQGSDHINSILLPKVVNDEPDNPDTIEVDYDSDEVQKPRVKVAKKSTDSELKRKQTPKRKPAKIEDGIIGMKVRSPTNGHS